MLRYWNQLPEVSAPHLGDLSSMVSSRSERMPRRLSQLPAIFPPLQGVPSRRQSTGAFRHHKWWPQCWLQLPEVLAPPLDVPSQRRPTGGNATPAGSLNVGTSCQQPLHHLQVALLACNEQWGRAIIHWRVDRCQEPLYNLVAS